MTVALIAVCWLHTVTSWSPGWTDLTAAWPAADCLRDLAGLGLDDETAALFLHGNAERVFGLAAAPEPSPGQGRAAGQQDTSEERAQA